MTYVFVILENGHRSAVIPLFLVWGFSVMALKSRGKLQQYYSMYPSFIISSAEPAGQAMQKAET